MSPSPNSVMAVHAGAFTSWSILQFLFFCFFGSCHVKTLTVNWIEISFRNWNALMSCTVEHSYSILGLWQISAFCVTRCVASEVSLCWLLKNEHSSSSSLDVTATTLSSVIWTEMFRNVFGLYWEEQCLLLATMHILFRMPVFFSKEFFKLYSQSPMFSIKIQINPLTSTVAIWPGYSYKASCARPG